MPIISLFFILLPLPYNTADFNFHSTSYDWLVIAGANVQYKRAGYSQWNWKSRFPPGGRGMDTFCIKIVDTTTDTVIYDSAGGSLDIDTGNQQINKKTIVEKKIFCYIYR